MAVDVHNLRWSVMTQQQLGLELGAHPKVTRGRIIFNPLSIEIVCGVG